MAGKRSCKIKVRSRIAGFNDYNMLMVVRKLKIAHQQESRKAKINNDDTQILFVSCSVDFDDVVVETRNDLACVTSSVDSVQDRPQPRLPCRAVPCVRAVIISLA